MSEVLAEKPPKEDPNLLGEPEKTPEVLSRAAQRAGELVAESALSPEEQKAIWDHRSKPFLDDAKARAKELERETIASGLRWSGDRLAASTKLFNDTERQLAENVTVPLIQYRDQLELQRLQAAEQAGTALSQAQLSRRNQLLAEKAQADQQWLASKEQGEASAVRQAGVTGRLYGENTLAGREQTLAEKEQAEASQARMAGLTGSINGQTTLAGRQMSLSEVEQRQANDARLTGLGLSQAELKERQRQFDAEQELAKADRTGRLGDLIGANELGVDVSTYLNADGSIKNGAAFEQAVALFSQNFKEMYGKDITAEQARALARGQRVVVGSETMSSKELIEKRRQFDTDLTERQRQFDVDQAGTADRFAKQLGLDTRKFQESVRQFDAGLEFQNKELSAKIQQYKDELAQNQAQFDATNKLKVAEMTGNFSEEVSAKDFGVDTSTYMNADGSVKDFQAFGRAMDNFAQNFKAVYGRDPTPTEAEALAKGQKLPINRPTLAKQQMLEESGLARDQLSEQRRQFDQAELAKADQFAKQLGLSRDEFMERKRQFDQGVEIEDVKLQVSISQFNQQMGEQRRQFNEDLAEKNRQFNASTKLEEDRLDTEKGRIAWQQKIDQADRTGYILDPSTGHQVPTLTAQAQADQKRLAEQGLKLEGDKLAQSAREFSQTLRQRSVEFAQQFGLDQKQADAMVASTMAKIDQDNRRLDSEIERITQETKLDWEKLGTSKEQFSANLRQQNMDRLNDMSKFAQQYGLDVQRFEQGVKEQDRQFGLTSRQVAQQFQMDQQKFSLAQAQFDYTKAETEERLRQGRVSQQQAQQQINDARSAAARQFGLDERRFTEASSQFDRQFEQQKKVQAEQQGLNQANFDEAKRQYDIMEKKRSGLFMDITANMDSGDVGEKEALGMLISLLNGSGYTAKSGGGGFWDALGQIAPLAIAAL